jgi:hypothetical protein
MVHLRSVDQIDSREQSPTQRTLQVFPAPLKVRRLPRWHEEEGLRIKDPAELSA